MPCSLSKQSVAATVVELANMNDIYEALCNHVEDDVDGFEDILDTLANICEDEEVGRGDPRIAAILRRAALEIGALV